jgi:predicted CXXCH cytochrome family protein
MTRKYAILFSVLVAMFWAVSANAQYSHIKYVVNSNHDLSITSATHGPKGSAETEICFFCHAPHQELSTSDASVTTKPNNQPPLWNHYLSSTASYGVYSSPTFDALGTDITGVGGAPTGSASVTNLCLSCHDGTVGVNTLYHGAYGVGSPAMTACGNGATIAANSPCLMPDAYLIGNPGTTAGLPSLASLHPVNFTYDATLAAKTLDLMPPAASTSGLGGSNMTAGGGTGGTPGIVLPLYAGKMQCATCHDVHNNTTNKPFLRDTTTASALCLDCHGK